MADYRLKRYIRGDIICRQGEAVDALYNMREGEIEVIVSDFNLRGPASDEAINTGKVVATIREPNSMLGEAGALLKHRSATLRAASPTELEIIPISPRMFASRLASMRDVALKMARNLARRIRTANAELSNQLSLMASISDLERRLAFNYYRLANEISQRIPGVSKAFAVNLLYKRGEEIILRSMDGTEAISDSYPELSKEGQLRVISPKQSLIHTGEVGETAFYVLEGRLGVFMNDAFIFSISPGQFVGEIAMLLEGPQRRTADVVALDIVKVLELDSAQFEFLLNRRGDLLAQLVESLSNRLENANRLYFSREEAFRELVRKFTRPAGIFRDLISLSRVVGQHSLGRTLAVAVNEFLENGISEAVNLMELALEEDYPDMLKEFKTRVPNQREYVLALPPEDK